MSFNVRVQSTGEWIALDLQGKIEVLTDELENLIIGQLEKTNSEISLTISNTKLIGKIVKLNKPLGILERVPQDEHIEPDEITGLQTKYRIVGVIRRKILFSQRPVILT
ncbi:putative chromosome transmission fidelity protein 8 [Blattamonas nauphoetae]|uniref:Chromosome transmission fidelity protein 8 n=1 Tax=Blattamonas nauphoetae TaxID=2049346 RepID=A0ABQ9YFY0_9EUKA|nr:putative chromosome transmission fidelity protein 8 [Blattamonas nauphoetae]